MKRSLLFHKSILLTIILSTILLQYTNAQELMDVFGKEEPRTEYTTATFKTTRIVSGHSIENPANGVLLFMISHHFGRLNQGAYDFFGLDQATIRLGLEYGINDFVSIGIGRSTYQKTIDGFIKAKVLRQSKGIKKMPFSLTALVGSDIFTLKWQDTERTNYFSSRFSYVYQLMLARKFSERLSLQLTPTLIHKNLVVEDNTNDNFVIGFGGRYKITKRLSLNMEYFHNLPGYVADHFENPFSVGFDIETGGHVFQLHFTNAQPMFDRALITETSGKWNKGDIFFGFNIGRIFTIKKPKGFD
ncbi:MAG: DUF5777 family beta-barrel protein [Chloroflexota bacterium]